MCQRHRSPSHAARSAAAIWIAALVCGVQFGCQHGGCTSAPLNFAGFSSDEAPRTATVARTLHAFHDAASRADEQAYFDLLAEDAVFLGTDATERWTKAEFQAYARPYFAQGKGWTYKAIRTDITIDHDIAWFDQELNNENWGPCRGSGVLRREYSKLSKCNVWRITQYNLSVPIPNDLMPEVTQRIRASSK